MACVELLPFHEVSLASSSRLRYNDSLPVSFAKIVLSPAELDQGRLVVAGCSDGNIDCIDLSEGKVVQSLAAHPNGAVNDLALCQEGNHVVSVATDGVLVVSDIRASPKTASLHIDTSSLSPPSVIEPLSVAVPPRPGSTQMLVGTSPCLTAQGTTGCLIVQLDMLMPGKASRIAESPHADVICDLEFSGCSEFVSSSWDGFTRRWDAYSLTIEKSFTSATMSPVYHSTYHPDLPAFIAQVCEDSSVRIWDMDSRQLLYSLHDPLEAAALSGEIVNPDTFSLRYHMTRGCWLQGKYFVCGSNSNSRLYLWNLGQPQLLPRPTCRSPVQHCAGISSVISHPVASKLLISSGSAVDDSLVLWRVEEKATNEPQIAEDRNGEVEGMLLDTFPAEDHPSSLFPLLESKRILPEIDSYKIGRQSFRLWRGRRLNPLYAPLVMADIGFE